MYQILFFNRLTEQFFAFHRYAHVYSIVSLYNNLFIVLNDATLILKKKIIKCSPFFVVAFLQERFHSIPLSFMKFIIFIEKFHSFRFLRATFCWNLEKLYD